ncbi:hypothetical protein, partial [Bartonella sp. M0193]|uniref:hypothetical protein n=1 Tax=Bartonella sp. M0193 TaxID=2750937 RepID=UPI001AED26E5
TQSASSYILQVKQFHRTATQYPENPSKHFWLSQPSNYGYLTYKQTYLFYFPFLVPINIYPLA